MLARRAQAARERSLERQDRLNSRMGTKDLDRHAPLNADMRELLVRAAERQGLSARAIQSLRRVARTLADLAEQDLPGRSQLAEALALRASL